jgi:membrane-bound lytic murein transglycosylase D
MAIQPKFLASVICFSLIFATGIVLPCAAESLFAVDTTPPEHEAVPPPFDLDNAAIPPPADLDRVVPFGEPPVDEVGSGQVAPPDDAVANTTSPLLEIDPFAEAFAESLRFSKLPPATYPLVLNDEVQFFLERFTGTHREVVGLWVNRSARFREMIRAVLKKHGLPEDLAYTAMIESGYNPLAVSRVGAKGMWQFMPGTARRYGLRVDHWVDERLDPEKSTVAAAAYLRDLHGMFGSWTLAQAAYNAGEVTVLRAIRATGSKDFWTLARSRYLRRETKDFVPQIQAATFIGRDLAKYGFELGDVSPLAVDTVVVPPATDLRRVAPSAGVPEETLRSLNAVLVRAVTPPGAPYTLRVPTGKGGAVLAAVTFSKRQVATKPAAAPKAPTKVTRLRATSGVHVVGPNDTVRSIAKRYGISVNDVLRWNRLASADRIRAGDRLRVADLRLSAERDGQGGFR